MIFGLVWISFRAHGGWPGEYVEQEMGSIRGEFIEWQSKMCWRAGGLQELDSLSKDGAHGSRKVFEVVSHAPRVISSSISTSVVDDPTHEEQPAMRPTCWYECNH